MICFFFAIFGTNERAPPLALIGCVTDAAANRQPEVQLKYFSGANQSERERETGFFWDVEDIDRRQRV